MNKRQHAEELAEEGLYNTFSALARINKALKKEERLTEKQFYDKLRLAGFLATGFTSKPHDSVHNKPFRWIREKNWASIAEMKYNPKGYKDITKHYYVAIYTQKGLEIIQRIINEPEFNLSSLRHQAQKPKPKPIPTPEEQLKTQQEHERFNEEFLKIFGGN